MSDDQSFPMESKTFPKLWDGAYSNMEKYTQLDIAAVVEYALFTLPPLSVQWGENSTLCT